MAFSPNGQQLQILGADGQPYRRNGADREALRRDPPQLWLPPQIASSSVFGGASRTYWHDRFDEALRNSRQDAHAFKRDARIQALLKERKRSVLHLKWHIDVPDVHDPDQKLVRDVVTSAIESIHDFQDVKSCLLEALWYGKYAVQWVWGKRWFRGVKTKVPLRWEPLHGDKIGYQWQDDGAPDVPYALIHGGSVGFLKQRGGEVIPSTMGLALLLKDHWRGRFCIHHHEIEDWDFWEPDQALMKHGVGLRSQVYWTEYLRKEIESWLTDFMERVGLGVTMWKYEAGNASALQEVQGAAKAYDRRVNVFVPCWSDGSGKLIGGVERVDPPLSGCEFLRSLMEYFDRQVERLFIGQEGSSKGMSAGLGNEATADLMHDTKQQITKEDAYRIGETFTGNEWNPGLVNQIVRWTEWPNPKMRELPAKMLFGIESTASEKKMSGLKSLFDMNVPFRAADARDAVGVTAPVDGDEVVKNTQLEAQAQQAKLQAQQMAQGGAPGAPGAPGGEQPPPSPEGGPGTPEPPDAGPPELGSFLSGLRDAGKEPDDDSAGLYGRDGEPIRYEGVEYATWTLDPPKGENFRVNSSNAANQRWRNNKTGKQRYFPKTQDPNKHGDKEPKSEKGEGLRLGQAKTQPAHEQQADAAFGSLAKLNEVGPEQVAALHQQISRMKPGVLKALKGKLQEAGIDLSASAGDRSRLANHIVDAVGERTASLTPLRTESREATRAKLAEKAVVAPPKLGAATPEAMRAYFFDNFDKVLGKTPEGQLRADMKQMGVALSDGASRDQIKTAFADHMASRAALARAFKNPAAGRVADAAMGKKAEAAETPTKAAPEAVPPAAAAEPKQPTVQEPAAKAKPTEAATQAATPAAEAHPDLPAVVAPSAQEPAAPSEKTAAKPSLMDRMRAKQEKIAPKPAEQPPAPAAEARKPAERPAATPEIPPETDVGGRHAVFVRNKDGNASLRLFKTAKEAQSAAKQAKKAGAEVYAGSTPKDMRYDTLQEGMNGIFAQAGVKPESVRTEFVGDDPVAANREQSRRTVAETRTLQAEKEQAGEAAKPSAEAPADPVKRKTWDSLVAQAQSDNPAVEREMRDNGLRSAQEWATWTQAGKPQGGAKKEPLRITQQDIPLDKKDLQPKTEAGQAKIVASQKAAKLKADKARLLSKQHQRLAESAKAGGDPHSEKMYRRYAEEEAKRADALEQGAAPVAQAFQQPGGASAEAGPVEKPAEPALTKRQEGGRAAADVRQAREIERGQARARFEEQAAVHGADPVSAHQVADEIRQLDASRVEGETNLLRQAQKQLAHYGIDPKQLRRDINRDKVQDPNHIKSLDVISESLAALPEFAEFFRDTHDAPGAAAEKLFGFLQETACKGCDPKPKSDEEIYGEALGRIEATAGSREPAEAAGEAAEPEGGDADFGFGANAPDYMPSAAQVTEPKEEQPEEPAGEFDLFGNPVVSKKQSLFNEPAKPDVKPRAIDKDKPLRDLSVIQKRGPEWDMPQEERQYGGASIIHKPTGNRIESDPLSGQYVVKDREGKKIGGPFGTADEAAKVAEQFGVSAAKQPTAPAPPPAAVQPPKSAAPQEQVNAKIDQYLGDITAATLKQREDVPFDKILQAAEAAYKDRSLGVAGFKAFGQRLGIPVTGSKAKMLEQIKNLLVTLKVSRQQTQFARDGLPIQYLRLAERAVDDGDYASAALYRRQAEET